MAFLKTHWISLLCGVLTIGFIVYGTLTMSSESVKAEMNKRLQETGANNIQQLIREPKSRESIEAKKSEGKEFDDDYVKTMQVAHEINKHEPLLPGVFPKPENLSVTPLKFRDAYQQAFLALTRTPALAAGTAPTIADITDQQADIDELLRLEQERIEETAVPGEDKHPAAATPTPPPPPQPPPTFGGLRGNPRGGLAPIEGGMPGRSFGASTFNAPTGRESEPKYNPVFRARVAKAKSIRCYAEPSAFHFSPVGLEAVAPSAFDMWEAQVGLWIQKDIVDAIASLNKEAAEKITEGEPCVSNMPVKRIVGIQVHGYVLPNKGLLTFPRMSSEQLFNPNAAPSGTGSTGPGVDLSPSRSFTGRTANDQYDVVRLTLALVADQRDLIRIVDRISRENFYLCTNMRYEAIDREQQEQAGYLYGVDPIVLVTMDFEAYMTRDVYEKMMPEAVHAVLTGQGAQQP